eukprot:1161301-Pelagomonas_calceolata.AAC.16
MNGARCKGGSETGDPEVRPLKGLHEALANGNTLMHAAKSSLSYIIPAIKLNKHGTLFIFMGLQGRWVCVGVIWAHGSGKREKESSLEVQKQG